jgi:hypothetical protein
VYDAHAAAMLSTRPVPRTMTWKWFSEEAMARRGCDGAVVTACDGGDLTRSTKPRRRATRTGVSKVCRPCADGRLLLHFAPAISRLPHHG